MSGLDEQIELFPEDQHNRPLRDLRISVIDRCNLRCPYCMPAEEYGKGYQFLHPSSWLTFEEITRFARLLIQKGVQKIRLTGGEPLLRPDLPDLIARLSSMDGLKDLALTTNGLWLVEQVKELRAAGLGRLTVSLDSLNRDVYRKMSGGRSNVRRVLDGIREAEEAGFRSIKINTVVIRGVNDEHVVDLVRYFQGTGHIIRFIEYMDVGNVNGWSSRDIVPSKQILEKLRLHFDLEPLESNYFGEVASRYRVGSAGEIGFVSSISHPFCSSCTRLRLSAAGMLYTCLFAREGHDIKTLLRNDVTDNDIVDRVGHLWTGRDDRYSELRQQSTSPETDEKVEMFHVGG